MTVKILLISHEDIGSALLNATRHTFGKLPIPAKVIGVKYDADPEKLVKRVSTIAEKAGDEGILILTDLYGATPCNIALGLKHHKNIQVISGLNMPMLIRVMNYPTLTLPELANKAVSGGKDGVVNCSSEHQNLE